VNDFLSYFKAAFCLGLPFLFVQEIDTYLKAEIVEA